MSAITTKATRCGRNSGPNTGNIRGARKLHTSVHGYLEPYAPVHLGLDLVGFLRSFDTCLAEVAASTEEFPSIELNPELLPEIHLDPAPPDVT